MIYTPQTLRQRLAEILELAKALRITTLAQWLDR